MPVIGQPVRTTTASIALRIEGGVLPGVIAIPQCAIGTVVFAHDSGTDHLNARDRTLAEALNHYGVATLLIDLLTGKEHEFEYLARGRHFDVDLQSDRLVEAIDWLGAHRELSRLPVGILGASTGAGVALRAAAERPDRVAAVVCRGGRPELAGEALIHVAAPTLLIVGGDDEPVLEMNRGAAAHLHCPHRVHVVEGATHLFEEAGKLDEVAQLAREWFLRHLGVRLH